MVLISWATHMLQWTKQRVLPPGNRELIHKLVLSGDWGLQLDLMNAELIVIANQSCRGEYVLASCTHRPSSQQSWDSLNSALGRGGFSRRWGLSRNKVSVLEGADGSPPFFFLTIFC